MIVDSQVHIWAADRPDRPWPKRPAQPHRAEPFTAAQLAREMDLAGVDRVVLIPPTWEGDRNDVALAAVRDFPGRFAVMGRIDVQSPDVRASLPSWKTQTGMLGLRFHFARPEYEAPLVDENLAWLWADAERYELPIMMNVTPHQIWRVAELASRHPRLRITIDHLAVHFGKRDAEAFCDLDRLVGLAKFENVAVKASSMPSYTAAAYPYRSLHAYLRRVYDAFGADRMFWGTDLSKLPCAYRQAVSMFTEEIPWFTETDKEKIMGRALCNWIGWQWAAVSGASMDPSIGPRQRRPKSSF